MEGGWGGGAIIGFYDRNQCLTGKTFEHDRPRYPVLQMLWGIITSTNVDYAELTWEEFVQAMQTFLLDKANLGSPTKKGRKDKPHVIPYCRFTKLIICYLGRIHNIHQRSASPFHLAEEDLRLGNLKFVSKGKVDEVFGMPIPNEQISNNIRNAPYYNAYLEMVAKHDQKVAAEKEGKKKTASAKQPKSKSATEKSSKPAPASKPKVTKEKPSKPSTAKPPKPKPAKEKSKRLHTHHEKAGKGKSGIRERQATGSSDMFCAVWAIREPVTEATRPLPVVEGDECEGRSKSRRRTAVKSDEVMMDQTLTWRMQYTNGDQFFNDKSTEDEPGKLNVEAEVVSMVTAQIYQASSSVPPMSTPVIDLSPPKPAPSTTQAPVFTTTTSTTTTTRPLPPPPQQQSITDSELAARVTTLEQKFAAFEQKSKTLDNTT
ncbi:hypothetical protein Tco_0885119 [Tanacetum coccineum]